MTGNFSSSRAKCSSLASGSQREIKIVVRWDLISPGLVNFLTNPSTSESKAATLHGITLMNKDSSHALFQRDPRST